MNMIKVHKFSDKDSWLDYRSGRITGTKAGSLLSKRDKKPLKGYYALLAERIAIPASDEFAMDRGIRLEQEALERFEKETGKKVNKDLVLICRDDNENICYSPDGFMGKTADVEVKCLNSAAHIEAWLTKAIPKEHEDQIIQGFVVNDSLKTRYMVFYDPRMPRIDFFYLEIKRKEFLGKIAGSLEEQIMVLEQLKKLEDDITFT